MFAILNFQFWHDKMKNKQEGFLLGGYVPALQKPEVMRMSDFELLTIVFTVIGLLLTAFKLGKKQ